MASDAWTRPKFASEAWKEKRRNSIKKPELQRLLLDKSPRLTYEAMQPGARYRTIYDYVFIDGERVECFLVCKLCRKPITMPAFGISGVKQHYNQHLMKGETPIYDNMTRMWNGVIDVRSALHQEDMEKFVVPIKLPHEAYIAMQRFRPVQLFMEISKVNFDQCPDDEAMPATKKAKRQMDPEEKQPVPVECARAKEDELPIPSPPPLVIDDDIVDVISTKTSCC